MKNTFKIEFHILYYIVGFFCFITGYFKDYIWISILILIHECGHITGAIWHNWKIEKVLIFPFGGMTILNEQLNRPIYQEWWIVLLGPLYQMLFYLLLSYFHMTNSVFTMYHFLLLGFNLLPMIPLDGSKMMLLLLEQIFPYYYAQHIGYWISIIVSFLLIGYALAFKNAILIVIFLFIFKENMQFKKQIPYKMKKFLLERYLYSFPCTKKRLTKASLYQIKRGCQYTYFYQQRWMTEKEVLRHYFQ